MSDRLDTTSNDDGLTAAVRVAGYRSYSASSWRFSQALGRS